MRDNGALDLFAQKASIKAAENLNEPEGGDVP
jgi:hypothetical protein